MLTQIEGDDDAAVATLARTFYVEPVLRTSPFIRKGENLVLFDYLVPQKRKPNK